MTFRLSYTVVEPAEAPARGTALVLHGVLGSGQNFRSFVKRLGQRRMGYRFVLADLRHHGKSHSAPPPDTLAACAGDVHELIAHLDDALGPIRALIGHSFGGKVALEVARAGVFRGQIWVLDANPGSQERGQGSEVERVIAAVRQLPQPLARRADVVPRLLEQGLSVGLANWMTTNLEPSADGYRWVFDLERIELLLADYLVTDLWPFLETRSQGAIDLHLVVAERSERIDAVARQRLTALATEERLRYHVVENAGHWLHVDNPERLLALFDAELLR